MIGRHVIIHHILYYINSGQVLKGTQPICTTVTAYPIILIVILISFNISSSIFKARGAPLLLSVIQSESIILTLPKIMLLLLLLFLLI